MKRTGDRPLGARRPNTFSTSPSHHFQPSVKLTARYNPTSDPTTISTGHGSSPASTLTHGSRYTLSDTSVMAPLNVKKVTNSPGQVKKFISNLEKSSPTLKPKTSTSSITSLTSLNTIGKALENCPSIPIQANSDLSPSRHRPVSPRRPVESPAVTNLETSSTSPAKVITPKHSRVASHVSQLSAKFEASTDLNNASPNFQPQTSPYKPPKSPSPTRIKPNTRTALHSPKRVIPESTSWISPSSSPSHTRIRPPPSPPYANQQSDFADISRIKLEQIRNPQTTTHSSSPLFQAIDEVRQDPSSDKPSRSYLSDTSPLRIRSNSPARLVDTFQDQTAAATAVIPKVRPSSPRRKKVSESPYSSSDITNNVSVKHSPSIQSSVFPNQLPSTTISNDNSIKSGVSLDSRSSSPIHVKKDDECYDHHRSAMKLPFVKQPAWITNMVEEANVGRREESRSPSPTTRRRLKDVSEVSSSAANKSAISPSNSGRSTPISSRANSPSRVKNRINAYSKSPCSEQLPSRERSASPTFKNGFDDVSIVSPKTVMRKQLTEPSSHSTPALGERSIMDGTERANSIVGNPAYHIRSVEESSYESSSKPIEVIRDSCSASNSSQVVSEGRSSPTPCRSSTCSDSSTLRNRTNLTSVSSPSVRSAQEFSRPPSPLSKQYHPSVTSVDRPSYPKTENREMFLTVKGTESVERSSSARSSCGSLSSQNGYITVYRDSRSPSPSRNESVMKPSSKLPLEQITSHQPAPTTPSSIPKHIRTINSTELESIPYTPQFEKSFSMFQPDVEYNNALPTEEPLTHTLSIKSLHSIPSRGETIASNAVSTVSNTPSTLHRSQTTASNTPSLLSRHSTSSSFSSTSSVKAMRASPKLGKTPLLPPPSSSCDDLTYSNFGSTSYLCPDEGQFDEVSSNTILDYVESMNDGNQELTTVRHQSGIETLDIPKVAPMAKGVPEESFRYSRGSESIRSVQHSVLLEEDSHAFNSFSYAPNPIPHQDDWARSHHATALTRAQSVASANTVDSSRSFSDSSSMSVDTIQTHLTVPSIRSPSPNPDSFMVETKGMYHDDNFDENSDPVVPPVHHEIESVSENESGFPYSRYYELDMNNMVLPDPQDVVQEVQQPTTPFGKILHDSLLRDIFLCYIFIVFLIS